MKLILASQSPRRSDLLKMAGFRFQIITSNIKEDAPEGSSPEQYVMSLAAQKALSVARQYPDCCVIGADTIVYLDGTILGKPHTPEIAFEYLKKMQGHSHVVYTGVAVISNGKTDVRYDTTEVTFFPMTDSEIQWYVSTGEPLDKAGAYGVQGPGSMFVEKIKGNYFNVVGLPIPLLYHMLQDAGYLSVGTSNQ